MTFYLLIIIALSTVVSAAADAGTPSATATVAHSATTLTLYVSPTGNDLADGRHAQGTSTASGPFASLQRARDEIRRLRTSGAIDGAVEVIVLPGYYPLVAPLELTERDSGTSNAPVRYRSQSDGMATLSAGRRLDECALTDAGLFRCDLSKFRPNHMTKLGMDIRMSDSLPPFEVFVEDRRWQLARWPNAGFTPETGYSWAYIVNSDKNSRDRFTYPEAPVYRWKSITGATVHIWPGNDWFDQYVSIAGHDTARRQMRLGENVSYPIQAGRRFAVLNLREELDTPGEWYYDALARQILLAPLPEQQQIRPTISVLDAAIKLQNASHIYLEGFTIEHSRKTAVTITDGRDVRIDNCTIRNAGGFGIEIRGGAQHTIARSTIHDTGYGGVVVNGGDRKTLTAGGHVITNSEIHHTGRLVRAGRAGLQLEGVGNIARHNTIHHTPGMAVLMIGNDHLLEFNDVHNGCEESSDCGAIYTGRDWTFHGNVIRHNHIHDIYGYGMQRFDAVNGIVEYATPHGARGVYLDDAASGFEVVGNVFYNIPYMMLQIGGGRDNVVDNNIFITRGYAIWMDARGAGFPWGKTMIPRLHAVPYDGPIWRQRFPKLAVPMRNPQWPEGNLITRNIVLGTPGTRGPITPFKYAIAPDSTMIDRNVVWNHGDPIKVDYRILGTTSGATVEWAAWKQAGFDKDSILADPQLMMTPGEFRLMEESPAAALGFRDIPYAKIPKAAGTVANLPATTTRRTYHTHIR